MKTVSFAEWLLVTTTLIACTFLGYGPGLGGGSGAGTVVYLLWGILDTVSTRNILHIAAII